MKWEAHILCPVLRDDWTSKAEFLLSTKETLGVSAHENPSALLQAVDIAWEFREQDSKTPTLLDILADIAQDLHKTHPGVMISVNEYLSIREAIA